MGFQESAPRTLPFVFADGRYELVAHLGSGGIGEVFRTIRRSDGTPLATKLLDRDLLGHRDMVSRFKAEARAMMALQNPHIVRAEEYGTLDSGEGYIVMELLQGRDLSQMLAEDGPMPEERAIRIGLQILDGLSHAHDMGIIHRDLKAENVVWEEESDQVKIIDFGLAKILDESLRTETMISTKRGAIFGTPSAMSPEQGMGQEVDHRADIYAFGILLYELLTNNLPFPARTSLEVIRHHLMTPPMPLAERLPGRSFSPTLWPILDRCLTKLPDFRFQSAKAVSAELKRILES